MFVKRAFGQGVSPKCLNKNTRAERCACRATDIYNKNFIPEDSLLNNIPKIVSVIFNGYSFFGVSGFCENAGIPSVLKFVQLKTLHE